MVHVHGAQVQRLAVLTRGLPPERLVAVPIDVGKAAAMVMACDFTGEVLMRPVEFAITWDGLAELTRRVEAAAPKCDHLVRIGIEAAGHYHRPLTAVGVWPADWQVLELNPAHVTAQRRVRGQRGVKTDQVDLAAMTDLLLAGHGVAVGSMGESLVELAALAAHRSRRIDTRVATKNQLLGQLERAFPGLTGDRRACWSPGGSAGRR